MSHPLSENHHLRVLPGRRSFLSRFEHKTQPLETEVAQFTTDHLRRFLVEWWRMTSQWFSVWIGKLQVFVSGNHLMLSNSFSVWRDSEQRLHPPNPRQKTQWACWVKPRWRHFAPGFEGEPRWRSQSSWAVIFAIFILPQWLSLPLRPWAGEGATCFGQVSHIGWNSWIQFADWY